MKFIKPFIVFLILNFGALGLGIWLMENGPTSEWYLQLNKAPWTPEGWVFGAAWTFIMLCFSIYMAFLYLALPTNKVKILFLMQFLLNVGWNYAFFNQHSISLGLLIIVGLTFIVAVLAITYVKILKVKSLLILPYLIWLCIASSLNLYILIYN